MNPRLRIWLLGALGVGLGVWAAFDIAEESYTLASLAVFFIFWIVAEWTRGAWPEGWVLAGALLGYVLANRGFAQLSLSARLPLLPAEFAMLICVPAMLVRAAFRQTAFLRRDALNIAVLLWIALGAARLWPDLRMHGLVAARDFATVYYAAFFFVGQAVSSHATTTRVLRRALLLAIAILPFSYLAFVSFPEFFLQQMVFRGVPLVYYKDDLIAAYLFAGFFLVMTVPHWPIGLRLVLGAASFATAFSINSSRAAIVGLAATSCWWVIARQWRPLQWQGAFAALGLAVLTVTAVFQNEPIERSRLYRFYEHFASMMDVSGTRHYAHEDRAYVGDNNRFRLVWWQSVADETLETSPVFGLGFGHDLSARFLRTYEVDLGEDFNTRSPHSILFTVLGRMGVVGLLAWLGIMGAMIARTLELARLARASADVLPALGWWSVAWVLLASACFGVVLEGPMGAVIFWTALGMANAAATLDKNRPPTATELSPAISQ